MKPWAYVVIVVTLIAAIGAVYKTGHSAGFNKRDALVQQEIIEAQDRSKKESEKRWAASVVAATNAIRVEERIVEKIREVEVRIPRVVERIVEVTPECADLGSTYSGMLNEQVRSGNGVQIATNTSEPAD